MTYVNAACTGCVTIFSTGGKFRLVSNFTEFHTLTQATGSYALFPPLYRMHLLPLQKLVPSGQLAADCIPARSHRLGFQAPGRERQIMAWYM